MNTVKPSTSQKLPKQGGMGFVEVLVASAILALTVAGSVTLLGGWTQTLSETRNRTDALVRLVSVMDLGKHEIALVNPSDPNYNASLVDGVVSPTQRISGFTVRDITAAESVNRTKFEASITWLNPYESGADANSKFGLHSYHPERRGFVSVSSLTTPVCVGAGCSGVDDDCIVSAGSKKGKAKSTKSDGTDCSKSNKTKSEKSVTYKSDSSKSKSSCTNTPQTVTIGANPDLLTVGQQPQQLTASSDGSNNAIRFQSMTGSKCTVSGSQVSPVDEGACIVKAVQEGNCTFAEGSETKNITVECNSISALSFVDGIPNNVIVRDDFSIRVEGGNSLRPYELSVSGGACTLESTTAPTTITYTEAGTCNITASQSGVCTDDVDHIIAQVTVETEYCEVSEYPHTTKSGKTTTKYEFYEENSAACACYEINSNTGALKASSAKAKSKYSQTCPYTKGKKDKTKTGT